MQTPEDLRHFDSSQYEDAFQILTPEQAAYGLFVVCLFLFAIEPVLR